MAENALRTVFLRRVGERRYVATNVRGGELTVGEDGDDFTPVELLLTAIAGCSAIDIDLITSRRAEPEKFEMVTTATKIRDEQGNRLEDIEVSIRITFPDGEGGDAAREVLPDAVKKTHDRLCTVSRTVQIGTPVTLNLG
ncbi:OsmC family peroxiredoxin [Jiangella ureilytica]|uniref:OsmC family peroxiredoxin n=1 Tax=Jiangella ureilytica TaxID=2530374 RepID=A0A4V2XYD2_9ACTN|nr:OsmC family protein [Jiangella ureilytica]TDC56665.1 OsmC family peroxiredoxin [Jiangella ureilytica]